MKSFGLDDWLRQNVWEASAGRVLFAASLGAVLAFLIGNAAEWTLDMLMTTAGLPSRLGEIKAEQATRSWISPLLIAPVLENAICWFWLRMLLPAERWGWWRGALVVSLIAGLFHVAVYQEPRYIVISINFFVICCLILNVKDRTVGFWASVVTHGIGNLLALTSLRILGL